MSSTSTPPARRIYWPSVITVVSAAILMGLDETFALIIQGVLFVIGTAIMVTFVRGAQRIEPFTRRS